MIYGIFIKPVNIEIKYHLHILLWRKTLLKEPNVLTIIFPIEEKCKLKHVNNRFNLL